MEYLHLSFSCQGRGSSTFSLACISSMCLKQRFPGGHSLRLGFWSFMIIYRRILAVLLSVKFSLPSLCWLTLGFCSIPASRNFGRQSCRHARLGDYRGFCVRVSSTIILRCSKHLQQLGGFFARRKDCGFAFTPTAGTQLSVGPRCDFDLPLDMSFLQPLFTRWSYGLGLGNGVSVAWFLCDSSISSIWFRRFT